MHSVQGCDRDTGLDCLVMLARYYQCPVSPEQLRHEYGSDGQRFGTEEIVRAARSLGFRAGCTTLRIKRLSWLPLPAIVREHDGRYCILARVSQEQVLIQRPGNRQPEAVTLQAFQAGISGEVIQLQTERSVGSAPASFDFTWFIPAVIKYRRLLGEVFIASLFIQLFALITPLFFQVVMDKVLVHHALNTLYVLVAGLGGVMVFESLLNALRSYVFSHTTSRIDVELGSRLFRQLISLPAGYFQSRRVGDSVARVRELENIRQFLTGNAITLVLDILFSVVFIIAMLFYSGWLTLVVVVSLPFYFIIARLVTPVLRQRLQEAFDRGAENQSFLVEHLSAIDTVKSMAVEPSVHRQWDNQLAGYVRAGFRTRVLSVISGELTGFVGKMVTLLTLLLGAGLVIAGQLTVGQLIAFNMLAGRVSQPVIRLAQMWTQFQQVRLSMQRLGDILNTPGERAASSRTPLPRLQGQIRLEQVFFRYTPDGQDILRNITLTLPAGSVTGIVGRSGSGKSTLTRLIQRFYSPVRGKVSIDGFDLALVDVASLRRQTGVVLQDSQLLNRSIRENIALADASVPLERVMEVARLAGAHDFITQLPEGYDTLAGERGCLLSGGQRQRIAIARALISNPRILILDEATSALDYESEHIIRDNMAAICRDRTVIIIAHRLSAVRHADTIVVLEDGEIVEQGAHDVLLGQQGQYARLWRMQQE
ncbi:type I secretion system permease/ATPase [Salmonella enterica subsp. enterica serovar Louisiana]|uniref:Alpha-hemolysin translocation ATP-binding protein HlyB n=2 Tax=Salmonella enterica I TaxID=59201 RepID=A0A5V0BW04_SALEN|nr:type I secretion system permease/ATPase [Salmonella enterica subsp. enterica serovar Louisiana]EBS5460944.1 type I secretion system permease/ATPase [Salmonella enterica subsp. enterica serovar Enteritidis]EBY3151845.1 type I secretion system permease/ATPase [Salmonella enterica subsp. enterica serovar Teshie]ECA1252801.1 type I secretion system permease/ATPase [Salmonella enterica subsp. enterica serovar Chailey]ECA7544109.1 type I secretion system permease/ATPase [Salmonella enterica subsp.